jgi:Xaa-Pro aminopeptidase
MLSPRSGTVTCRGIDRKVALIHEERLRALREELVRRKLDGFIVPIADEHMSEYVGANAQRLAWLTGFLGSAGAAVVLLGEAAIFVDGRYNLQVREQVDHRHWSFQSAPPASITAWLEDHVIEGMRIGYDPWLHVRSWVTAVRAVLAKVRAELIAIEANPVDAVWPEQPNPSDEKLVVYSEKLAGSTSAQKRQEIAQWLLARQADAIVLSALDCIAWTFNVRGRDIDHTPVALAYALVNSDATADLFVAPAKLTEAVVNHLGETVRLHSRGSFVMHLSTRTERKIAVDPGRTPVAILDILEQAGVEVIEARDPIELMKAIKNSVEIEGHKAAQARDGAALTRFLHWFSTEAPKGGLTELSAAARLQEFREATGELLDLSFDTISGFGPNGAIVHYRANEITNRPIVQGSLYLVDSGGQYADGTTDVTRTISVGAATAEMRDRFTRVLKGHIALASAVFPAGTRGGQLDTLARQYLWAAGFDYAHGTGHGVGAYLCVHEGPQRIAACGSPNGADEPLLPGMIISNEPGYYKAGDYGIRIENLLLVVKRNIAGAEREMLGFETLTLAPLDRTLIDSTLLRVEERLWIDSYHANVARLVGPQLAGAEKAWLMTATRPLE